MSRNRLRIFLLIGVPTLLLAVGLVFERVSPLAGLQIAVQRTPARLPSSLVIPEEEILKDGSLLSVYTPVEQLNNPETGILANPMNKGRQWENPTTVSYFDRGRLIFAGSAGLRIHGGKSRIGSPVQSFRLYFRKDYSPRQFMPGVLFEGKSDPITRLVVHNDLRQDGTKQWWHLVNPLAYEIARQFGSITPYTQPVRFFLNGQYQGVYVLSEHVRKGFLKTRYGHDDFLLRDRKIRRQLRRTVRNISPLTMADVDKIFDLENLTRWFISIVFCATTDPFQALMFLDNTRSDARWFLVNWDMDHSFMDLYRQSREPWQHNTFRTTLGQRPIESQIITRLLSEDPDFGRYLMRMFVDALNHKVTSSFLKARFDYYQRVAERYGVQQVDYLKNLEQFLKMRPDRVRTLLARYVKAGPSYLCQVEGPPGVVFSIDGYSEPAGFSGSYFSGMGITVELTKERHDFSHWVVNDHVVTASRLHHRIRSKTVIKAVFLSDKTAPAVQLEPSIADSPKNNRVSLSIREASS